MKIAYHALWGRHVFAILLFLISGATCQAESIDVFTAYRLALSQHPTIAQRAAAIRIAEHELEAAEWQRYPSVGVEANSVIRQSSISATGAERRGGVWRVQQSLWTGGRIDAEISAARERQGVANSGRAEAEQQLLERVADAYVGWGRFQARRVVAEQNLGEHEKLHGLIQRRAANNISSRADLVLAKARLQQARSELESIELAARRMASVLEHLLGRSLQDIHLQTVLPWPGQWEDAGAVAVLGEENSPQIRRLQQEIALTQAEAAARRAALQPQWSLRYEKNYGAAPSTPSDRWLLAVEFQPGAGLSAWSASQAAAAKVGMAQAEIEIARRELIERIEAQFHEMRSMAAQKETAEAYAESAAELVASYLRQFTAGKKTWQEVLNAQREAAQAAFAAIDAASGEILASHRLAILGGELTAASLQSLANQKP